MDAKTFQFCCFLGAGTFLILLGFALDYLRVAMKVNKVHREWVKQISEGKNDSEGAGSNA
jgi:isocitrate dehydrogenase kinase/phosphatase